MSLPNRPNNTREIQRKLAAGDKFKEINSKTGNVLQLIKIDLPGAINNCIQAFELSVNGSKLQSSIYFIQCSCIHKVESIAIFNILPEVITHDLFFVEIEFID